VKFLPVILSGLALFLLGAAHELPKRLFINESPSMKQGIYLVYGGKKPKVGETVLITLPGFLRDFAKTHSFLSRRNPLLKKVAAVRGDKICGNGRETVVNEKEIYALKEVDAEGRPLPKYLGCQVLESGEFFPVGENSERSFDGRYFGPLDETLILGKAKLLFEF
jgi:conjugative transfer signal peptidase TraF